MELYPDRIGKGFDHRIGIADVTIQVSLDDGLDHSTDSLHICFGYVLTPTGFGKVHDRLAPGFFVKVAFDLGYANMEEGILPIPSAFHFPGDRLGGDTELYGDLRSVLDAEFQ